VFDSHNELMDCAAVAQATAMVRLDSFTHTLTHRDIVLHPIVQQVPAGFNTQAVFPDSAQGQWVAPDQVAHIGLPVPVTKLLVRLQVRP
jgi:A/G-specific adenine glycosylase